MTPDKLRFIADWLDRCDRLIERVAAAQGDPTTLGSDVQQDLRRWADEIEQARRLT